MQRQAIFFCNTPQCLTGNRHDCCLYRIASFSLLQLVGSQFVYAIKPHLEDCWSKELEDAWLQLFRVMSYHMKKGMQSQNSVITY